MIVSSLYAPDGNVDTISVRTCAYLLSACALTDLLDQMFLLVQCEHHILRVDGLFF